MPQDRQELRRQAVTEFATISAIVYVAAGLVLVVPGFFLATGVQAIGAGLDWWAGDPDSDDGEEVIGTTVGLVSATIVLTVAAAMLAKAGRRSGLSARIAIAVGTGVIVVALCAVCVWVVTA